MAKAKRGRPTKYSANMLKKAREYIEQCVDEYTEFHKSRGSQSNSFERIVKVKLPSIEGLSLFLGVTRSTVYLWRDNYQDFSDTLDEIEALQRERLITGGLGGDYNSTIAKLVLSANHGMTEKTDITSDGRALATTDAVTSARDEYK